MEDFLKKNIESEKAVLVGIITQEQDEDLAKEYIQELDVVI